MGSDCDDGRCVRIGRRSLLKSSCREVVIRSTQAQCCEIGGTAVSARYCGPTVPITEAPTGASIGCDEILGKRSP